MKNLGYQCEDCGTNHKNTKKLCIGHVTNFLYSFDVYKKLCPECYRRRSNESGTNQQENHTE